MSDQQDSAFEFTGRWQEFAPIAFTNLLLTIVTLGIYRFWATTRSRQYFWSRTRFIDSPLEWTGTGKELFFGFLIVLLVLIVPLIIFNIVIQGMIVQGNTIALALIAIPLYIFLFYLIGVAIFRGLRYRLSRTLWRGIRGGTDNNGLGYGGSYLWKSIVGALPAGLLIPWSMTRLWNERWSAMSFGNQGITSDSTSGPIYGRFLLFYLLPVAAFVAALAGGAMMVAGSGTERPDPSNAVWVAIPVFLIVYIGLPLLALSFYAAFFRNAVGHMRWAGLEFGFTARTKDWLWLALGNLGLVIVTLGIGAIFIPYRNWKFFVQHMQAYGEIDMAALGQSTTSVPTQGEGLLDAFDMGAI